MTPFRSPVVIFEGPDGAGKSGLAYAVARKLNAIRVANGPPVPGEAKIQFTNTMAIADAGSPVVVDRIHWGDLIYAPKYRPDLGAEYTVDEALEYNLELARKGAIWITVMAKPQTLLGRHDERPEIAPLIEVTHTEFERQVGEYGQMHYNLVVKLVEDGRGDQCALINTTHGFDEFDRWVADIVDLANRWTGGVDAEA